MTISVARRRGYMRAWVTQNFRRLGGRKQNVVVRGVFGVGEFVRRQMPAQMIAAPGGDVQGAENFFVLDVAARRRQVPACRNPVRRFRR